MNDWIATALGLAGGLALAWWIAAVALLPTVLLAKILPRG